MVVIGVTGGFGTGKTTVAGIFKKLGAVVFDADKIAHEALRPKSAAYNKILKTFGRRILKNNGEIERRRLGKIVFSSRLSLKRLCGIVHPYVIKKIKRGIKKIKKKSRTAIIVLDIPLLIEAGLLSLVDRLVVVKTDRKTQIKRCREKTGLGKKEVLTRIKAQMPIHSKVRFSDFVIDNSGGKQKTKREVRKIWQEIQ